jgi:hypothetical protein
MRNDELLDVRGELYIQLILTRGHCRNGLLVNKSIQKNKINKVSHSVINLWYQVK